VLGHDHVPVFLHVGQHAADLLVRQVLQHLPDEAQIAVRQLIFDDVQARETHAFARIQLVVLAYQIADDVDPRVRNAGVDQLSADPEIAAAEIDYPPDTVIPDERGYDVCVRLAVLAARAAS